MSWQKILAQGFTSVRDLLSYLELPLTEEHLKADKIFPTRIPLGFAQRMQKRNLTDPLLLQVLAAEEELINSEGYGKDPLSESSKIPIKGLIHKYKGRVLLTLTGVCAVNCRFCFRRHFPYKENNPGQSGRKEIFKYIAQDQSIKEVILSGGDPLLASNVVFKDLIQELEGISHVHTLRIHTRIPVVLPERIDEGFQNLLSATRLKKVMILHSNHPQELDDSVKRACLLLQQSGCVLLNQSVLLTGINDNASILAKLSEDLFAYGVLPYYLHILDKVQGAAHFDMPLNRARSLYSQLRALLPGYLVPRLACDEVGQVSKTLVI